MNHDLTGNRLDPVILHTRRGLGRKPDIHRTVGVRFEVLVLTTDARVLLIRLQYGTGLGVIHDGRLKIIYRNIRLQFMHTYKS
jgi:hypothetical protein